MRHFSNHINTLLSYTDVLLLFQKNVAVTYIRKGLEAPGGGTPHMKGVGMLVVWLSSDFGLTEGVQGKKQSQLAVKISFRVAREKILKYVCCPCFNMVSFRVQKKVGLRPDRSLLGV